MLGIHSIRNMSAFNQQVDDLNLDFTDRNWETRPQNGFRWPAEFKLHDTDNEKSDTESETEEVDMDDEYFFDHRLDFGHYAPKVNVTNELSNSKCDINGVIPQKSVREVCDKTNTSKADSSGNDTSCISKTDIKREISIDENRNEKKRVKSYEITNGDPDTLEDLSTIEDLSSAIERFNVAARRNDREEIRKKLAFGGEDDSYDDNEDEEAGFSKPRLQSRLHSGLQICFMNESPGDTDNEGVSPRQPDIHDNARLMAKVSNLVDSDNNLSTVEDLNQSSTPPTTATQSCSPPRLKAGDLPSPADDFHSRQERLQNEAKLALAQAGSMAHMQLEIEKQTKKKSPIAEMAGIPGLGERRRKKLAPRQLQQMNLAQTQVLYNDLQTQIESLNEDLVRLLMERDELHMEQDSMLVDIEDLTRHAEELADRANRQANAKPTSSKGKMPAR